MKYCILGKNGYIGTALSKKIEEIGEEIVPYPTPDINVLIHLASPSHPQFEQNVPYHMGEAIRSFELLLPYCKENGIFFVYASSALVYETKKKSPFRNCKNILEQMAEAYGAKTLGLRIFPVYGPNDMRTMIAQSCHSMKRGLSPKVYGDGTQTRDFIYIDDVVNNMIRLIKEEKDGILDIGGNKPVSFNQVVEIINNQLGTSIQPRYINLPPGYSAGICCKKPVPTHVSIEEGIRNILNQ